MKKTTKRLLLGTTIVVLVAAVIFVVYQLIVPSPCFSQESVEEYVFEYSKDFSFVRNESYSVGLNGFEESEETDWYFHDNELDFDFHVKTLKSEISGGKHISCNYYSAYVEKLIDEKGPEIKQIVLNTFIEICDMEEEDICFLDADDKIRIVIEGQENIDFSKERYTELCKIASEKICEYLERYDTNLKNRSLIIGWDVGLNTDWSSVVQDFSITIDGNIYKIRDYYNNK